MSVGACQKDLALENPRVIFVFWAGTAAVRATAHASTALRRAVYRPSTAIAEYVFSAVALALDAAATWSAVMFGFARSWLMTVSYSMPSMLTYSWEPTSAVALPFHRSMISIWAMLQAS